jgi:hypothetical protein
MSGPFWVQLAGAVQSWATAATVVLGGAWALYRFGIQRERETGIGIELSHKTIPYGAGVFLVAFDIALSNKAKVRVRATRERRPAYKDDWEGLNFGGDLLIRPLPSGVPEGSEIRWFSKNAPTSPQVGDIEADLLDEYELNGETDFWMEPGETYHLATNVVLRPGGYLCMVTFVGAKSKQEFWRRMFLVQVPAAESRI